MESKSVPKSSKIGPETALKGDSVSKLKKEGAESVETPAREHKLEGFGPSGRETGRGQIVTTRLTTLSKDKGSADIREYF